MSEYNHDGVVDSVGQPAPYGATPAPINANGSTASQAAGIDKVRDILFGSQTKSNEARFARLEEGLSREVFEIKDMLRRRVESLEAFFHSETQALADRIREERDERMSSFEAHDLEMKGALTSLARRLGDLNIAMNEGNSAVRRELMSESRKLLEEITLRHDSVRGVMESRVAELHTRKADRAVISDLMRELATQLEKDDVPAE
jgi:hypothetical protein